MNSQDLLLSSDTTIKKALEVLDVTALQITLVVDQNMKLLGTVTDGDIRRGLLRGLNLQAKVSEIMNITPITVGEDVTKIHATSLMQREKIHQLPVMDKNGFLVGLHLDNSLQLSPRMENDVVLMAGGFGKRLNEMTENCPKPMLKIGTKPILETIIDSFIEAGFYKFTISLGYLGHIISEYFEDGKKWGVQIEYIEETEPLGTAGALSRLKNKPTLPFIVMNGDLLTKVDLKSLLQFHRDHKAIATMCVRGFENNIPYGVVKVDRHHITSLEEKPVQSVLVNAGIYVCEPKCLDLVPKNKFFNITDLFDKLIAEKKKPAAFPIHEYWIDIGQKAEFDRAETDYIYIFEKKA